MAAGSRFETNGTSTDGVDSVANAFTDETAREPAVVLEIRGGGSNAEGLEIRCVEVNDRRAVWNQRTELQPIDGPAMRASTLLPTFGEPAVLMETEGRLLIPHKTEAKD